MSNRKNNAHKEQIQLLEELRAKVVKLELKIKKQKKENIKQLNRRNLKVVVNTCNFAAPFVLSAGIIVGLFKLFGGGLPFHLDEITKYKVYNLDFQTKEHITMEKEYRTNSWLDDSLPSNTLVVYTPWEEQNGQFVRIKIEYDVEKITTLDLYDAVLDENYLYIFENLKEYKEEKQVSNEVGLEDNIYSLEASLHMLDADDFLKYNETDLKNKVITSIELILALGIGGVIAYFRDFEFLYELKRINNDYICNISSIQPMEQELKETNEKILSLTRTEGSKN